MLQRRVYSALPDLLAGFSGRVGEERERERWVQERVGGERVGQGLGERGEGGERRLEMTTQQKFGKSSTA